MSTDRTWRETNRQYIDRMLDGVQPDLQALGVHDASDPPISKKESSTHELRRRRKSRADEPVSVVTLRDDAGILRWELGPGFQRPSPAARRRRRAAGPPGEIVKQIKFEDLEPNQVDRALGALDERLTPNQGLHLVQATGDARDAWRISTEAATPAATGRILLLVHGTFSNGENLLGSLAQTSRGKQLLAWAGQQYDQILAFNHPTLSVSPALNAVDLARAFRGSTADVDIVCHSRGGLVARWWLEVLDRTSPRSCRVVFVGAPLAGTSLAAPHRLKDTINLLTNISRAMTIGARVGAAVVPVGKSLFLAATGLLRIFTSVTSALAKTPLIDGGIALIPGLAAQSRQGANSQILRLRDGFAALSDADRLNQFLRKYYFITANFEPPSAQWWKFWKHFNRKVLLDRWADRIFEGANDLVVDTRSMTDLTDRQHLSDAQRALLAKGNVCVFRRSRTVHHLNYFEQTRALTFIHDKLRG